MEEHVGLWWHRRVTQWTDDSFPKAAVSLDDVRPALQLLHHAGGGDGARRLLAASERSHGGKRRWLQRVAGTGLRAALPTVDADTWALPAQIAVFDDAALNRELYLWLAAQVAQVSLVTQESAGVGWIDTNLRASQRVLAQWPGWRHRYQRLLNAHLQARRRSERAAHAPNSAEDIVQRALLAPLSDQPFPTAADMARYISITPSDVAPVWLWVDTEPLTDASTPASADREAREPPEPSDKPAQQDRKRRRARATTDSSTSHGMLMVFRAESILSWSEFVRINRTTDDEELDDASQVADDLQEIAVAPGEDTVASRVKFDLDLPSAAMDDRVIAGDILLPEWNHRSHTLEPNRCNVVVLTPSAETPWQPTPALRVAASRARRKLEQLKHAPTRQFAQPEGQELDVDAWVRWQGECTASAAHPGAAQPAPNVFMRYDKQERDLSTLLLADLSLSTDAWAGSAGRVIELIRDALWVYGEAMHGLGCPFAIQGFSSVKRDPIRIHAIKGFDEPWGNTITQRIGAIKPGYYTRMGAAVRYATQQLENRPERQRLLLLLTDGKPNDLDHYEGRFGLEDTRHAVESARQAGIVPFAVTIDDQATHYLPYLFGGQHYAQVHRPQQLVGKLTQVMAALLSKA